MAVPSRGTASRRGWTPCFSCWTNLFLVYYLFFFLAAIDVKVWLVKAENVSSTSSASLLSDEAPDHERDSNNGSRPQQEDSVVRPPSLLWANSANVSDVKSNGKPLAWLSSLLGSRIAIVDHDYNVSKGSAIGGGSVILNVKNETASSKENSTNSSASDANKNATSAMSAYENVTFIDRLSPQKNINAFITDRNDKTNRTTDKVGSEVQGSASMRVELPTLFYEDVRAKHAFMRINSPMTTPRKNGDAGEKNKNKNVKNNNNNNNKDNVDGKEGLLEPQQQHEKNTEQVLGAVATMRGGEAREVTAERNGRTGETGKEGDTLVQESRSPQFSKESVLPVEQKENRNESKNNPVGQLEKGVSERNTRATVEGSSREESVQSHSIIPLAVLSTAPYKLPLGDDVHHEGSSGIRDSADAADAWTGREEAEEKVFELANRDEELKKHEISAEPLLAPQPDMRNEKNGQTEEKLMALKKQGSLAKWSSPSSSWTEQKPKQSSSLNQNGKSNFQPPPVELGGAEGWLPPPDHSIRSAGDLHQPDLYWTSQGRPVAVRVGDDDEGLPLKMEVSERGSWPEAKHSMSLALVTGMNNETRSETENGHGSILGDRPASDVDALEIESLSPNRNNYPNHNVVRRDVVTPHPINPSSEPLTDNVAFASEKRSIDVANQNDQLTDRGDMVNPKMKTPVKVELLHQGSLGVLPNKPHVTESESTIQDRHSSVFRDPRRHENLHFNGHTEGERKDGFVVRIPDGSNFAIQKRRQHQLEHNRNPNHFSGSMLGFNQGPRPFDQRDQFVLFDMDVPSIVAQMPEKFIPNFNHQRPHQVDIVHRPHPPVVEVQHFPPLPSMHHFAPPTPPRSRPNQFREHNTPTSHFRETNRPPSTPRPMQSHIGPNFRRPFNASHEGRVMSRPVFVDHQVSSPDIHIRIPTSVGPTQVDGPWTFFDEKPMRPSGPLEEMEISPPLFHSPSRPSSTSTPPPHREQFRPSFHSTESASNQDFSDAFRHQNMPMHHESSERPVFHDQVFLQQANSGQSNFDQTSNEHSIRIHIENGEPSTIRKPPSSFHNSFNTNGHNSQSSQNQHLKPNVHSFESNGPHHSSTMTPQHHSNQNNHFGDSGHHQSTTPRPVQHHSNMNNHHMSTSERPIAHHMTTPRPTQPHRKPSIEIITRLPVVTAGQNRPRWPAHDPSGERRPTSNRPVPIEIDIFSEHPSTTPHPSNNGFRPTDSTHNIQKPSFRPQQFDSHQQNFNHDTINTNNRPWQQNSDFNNGFNSGTQSSRPTTHRFPDHTRPFQNFKPTQQRPNIEIPNRFQFSTRPSKFKPGTDVAPHWENTQVTQHFQEVTRPPHTRPNIEILHNDQVNTRPQFQHEATDNPQWTTTSQFWHPTESFRPTQRPSTRPSFHSQESNIPVFHSSERPADRPDTAHHEFMGNNQNNNGFNSHANNFNFNNNHNTNPHSSNNFNPTSTVRPTSFSRPDFDHVPDFDHHSSFNPNHDDDQGFTVEPDPAVIPPRPPFLPPKPDPMYVNLEDNNRNQQGQPTLHITPRPQFTTPVSTTTRDSVRHSNKDHHFTTPPTNFGRPQQERPTTNFRDFKTSKGNTRNTFSITTSRPAKTSFNSFENHFIKTTKHEEHKSSPTSSLFDVTTHSTPVLRSKPTTTSPFHDFPTFEDDQQRVPIPKFLTPLVKFRDNGATENSLVPNSAVQITPKAIATPEFTATRFPNSFSTTSNKFPPTTFKPGKNHRGKFKDEDDYDTLFTPVHHKPQVVRITTPTATVTPHSSSQSTSRRPSSLPNDFRLSTNHQPVDDDFDEYEDFHDEQDEYEHEHGPTTPTSAGDKELDFVSNSVSSTPFPSNQGNIATGGHPTLLGFPPSLSPSPHKPSSTFSTKPPSGGINRPQRPSSSNVNHPTADSVALPCDHETCQLPHCFCGGNNIIPGDLSANEVPQLVMLTFDDDVNEVNWALYKKLLYTGRQNPNGCPISTTFYVSHEWTDYSKIQTLYADGHEIASHSISHPDGARFSKRRWEEEIYGQKQILSHMGNVPMQDIQGMRAPFLAVGGNKMFGMLYDKNFTYDSSLPVPIHDPPFWPYTLDYSLGHDCMIPPCPRNSYPSLWELPMVMWVDLKGGRCSMADACMWGETKEKVTANLMKNFQRHYKSNRAPFNLFFHSAWFDKPHNMEGFQLFLDKVLSMPDVYFVTASQVIEWMRQPTPLREIHSFVPFSCHLRSQNVGACKKPHECQLRFKGGETRYVRTCQECPSVYPWINNPYGLSNAKQST